MTLCIQDVITEGTNAPSVPAISGFTPDEVIGIMAVISVEVNQSADEVTDDGLGLYGIDLADLQGAGIVKKGIATTGDLATILADSSIYTGKFSVNGITDILVNSGLQRDVIATSLSSDLVALFSQGLIPADASSAELAGIAGTAAEFGLDDARDWLNGDASDDLTALMDASSADFEYAVNLVNTKASDILGQVQGIGIPPVSLPELSIGTIDTVDIDGEVDKLIGSVRIPSAGGIPVPEIPNIPPALNPEDLI